jgi:hypothetical protein
MTAPFKQLDGFRDHLGGSTPIAKILLPQFAGGLPIRLMASGSDTARRIAESRRRRIRPV